MESLRGHTSGLAVPTFVVDAPGGGGKIPLSPNYLVSAAPGRIVLRNFEGAIFSYPDPGTVSETPALPAHSVADLTAGKGSHIIPQDQPHYQRRRKAADERNRR